MNRLTLSDAVSTYLTRPCVLQLKHIHCVVDSATIVIKLNISCEPLYSNLNIKINK